MSMEGTFCQEKGSWSAGMLILGLGLGLDLNAKFLGFGLGILWP